MDLQGGGLIFCTRSFELSNFQKRQTIVRSSRGCKLLRSLHMEAVAQCMFHLLSTRVDRCGQQAMPTFLTHVSKPLLTTEKPPPEASNSEEKPVYCGVDCTLGSMAYCASAHPEQWENVEGDIEEGQL